MRSIAATLILFFLADAATAVESPRFPVPAEGAQKKAAAQIQEIYKPDYERAKSSSQKLELAQQMLKEAAETNDDAVAKFVLLRVARDIAVLQGDLAIAFQAVDRIGDAYEVDAMSMKIDAATTAVKSFKSPAYYQRSLGQVLPLVDTLVESEQYDTAKRVVELALSIARGCSDGGMLKMVTTKATEIDEIISQYKTVEEYAAILKEKATDPKANLELGKFRCFVRGDWERGIPMLALGNDETLKKLAKTELQDKVDYVTAGDAWWEYAESLSPMAKKEVQSHAAGMYVKVVSQLMGLTKKRLQQRIAGALRQPTAASSKVIANSIGMALTGREKEMKESLLELYGGTALTEESVRLGLEWLKENQKKNGLWSLTGPYADGAINENSAAATAMALIAFQGAGHTHKDGNYRSEVEKAWNALLDMQDRDGLFFHEGVHNHRLYTQAQCTMALCEIYGMTKDPKFKKPAQLAVDYAIRIQSRQGGWRYTPGEDADLSVTGWFVIALQSAMMAGLEVPKPALDKTSEFLESVASENGTRYSYQAAERGPTPTMTAEALLCRQYLGWPRNDPRLIDGVRYVLKNPIDWDGEKNVYYWYYASQVAHHMEGEYWDEWNKVMRQVLPSKQEKSGNDAGSWSPSGDRWGGYAGRLYETCLCIYMLEVYYRHLPVYGLSDGQSPSPN